MNRTADSRLVWPDALKGLALAWIFWNHVAEQIFGYPLICNPSQGWPPLAERVAQLAPLNEFGWLNLPLNVARYVGWSGDEGVQLFLTLSGFGLMRATLAAGPGGLRTGDFYRRRFVRIFPPWFAAHGLVALTAILAGVPQFSIGTWLASLVGLRFTVWKLYAISPAWWFIGLLIQLYALFPLLARLLVRLGPGRFLLGACLVCLPLRAAGLLWFDAYLDAWSRGAIFVTRLPEFALGMSLAAWLHADPTALDRRWLRPGWLAGAVLMYVVGVLCGLTLLGNAVSPLLLGTGALIVAYAGVRALEQRRPALVKPLAVLGAASYSLYLTHHLAITWFVPFQPGLASAARVAAGCLAAIVATVVMARAIDLAVQRLATLTPARAARWAVTLAAGAALLALAGETAVRRYAPQEVYGWGERPALEPHPQFGWRMKPAQTTRLRWIGYDYTCIANTLGFPGPQFSPERSPGVPRVLTTGDAFTSAEGVDTGQAWPRLLEQKLSSAHPSPAGAEVLNFAVTGYGPNQYLAIVQEFVPRYRPDLVLVELFANDVEDVLLTHEQFQQSIGFGRRDPDTLGAWLRLGHLRQWWDVQRTAFVYEWLRRQPDPQGYFLGGLRYLERESPQLDGPGRAALGERLRAIRDVCRAHGATLVLLMAPAPVQVCDRGALAYFPQHVTLSDERRFDLDKPQRILGEIADGLGLPWIDLRPALRDLPDCPYQPHNLHWTPAGHAAVAAHVAETIRAAGWLPGEAQP